MRFSIILRNRIEPASIPRFMLRVRLFFIPLCTSTKMSRSSIKATFARDFICLQGTDQKQIYMFILLHLNEDFDDDFAELVALIDGMVLLGEVTPRTMDYLFSFGERLSIKLVSSAGTGYYYMRDTNYYHYLSNYN